MHRSSYNTLRLKKAGKAGEGGARAGMVTVRQQQERVRARQSAAAARSSLYTFAAEEVPKRVKVLYVPDYVAGSSRLNASSELWKELSTLLPKREVDLALSE